MNLTDLNSRQPSNLIAFTDENIIQVVSSVKREFVRNLMIVSCQSSCKKSSIFSLIQLILKGSFAIVKNLSGTKIEETFGSTIFQENGRFYARILS